MNATMTNSTTPKKNGGILNSLGLGGLFGSSNSTPAPSVGGRRRNGSRKNRKTRKNRKNRRGSRKH